MEVNAIEGGICRRVVVDQEDEKGDSSMYQDQGLAVDSQGDQDSLKEPFDLLKNPPEGLLRCL